MSYKDIEGLAGRYLFHFLQYALDVSYTQIPYNNDTPADHWNLSQMEKELQSI